MSIELGAWLILGLICFYIGQKGEEIDSVGGLVALLIICVICAPAMLVIIISAHSQEIANWLNRPIRRRR